jgi:hypothetical protein
MGFTNIIYEEKLTLVSVPCANCGVIFGIPLDLRKELQENHKAFFCPNGHSLSYTGENFNKTELQKRLREAENKLVNTTSEKIQLEGQLRKTKNDLTRLKNGVCPCCNRSFKGLHEHIKRQHPDYKM